MDTAHDTLGRLRLEWRRTGRTPDATATYRRFVGRHHDLALEGLTDLGDLVTALELRGGRTVEQRCAVVRALLEDAREPLIHRTLLQTMLPGIVSVCRQLRFGHGVVTQPSETLDEALSLASELLTDWAGQSRPYAAPDLLSALRGRLRRWLLKEKDAQRRLGDGTEPDVAVDTASPLLSRLNAHVGGPHDRLARLTYARVFENRPLGMLAREADVSPVRLQRELRQFALKFLL